MSRAALAILGTGLAVAVVPIVPARADSSSEPLYALIDAATLRLQNADAVAAGKWLGGGPITDPARVQQVLAAVSADAESVGVPVDYVARVFTDQINATEAIEYSRFSWWKLDPAAAPESAPDLSSSRAVIDRLNHRMVDEIAGQWTVLHSPDCPIRLGAARTAVAADRSLEPLYVQALYAATRSYCS